MPLVFSAWDKAVIITVPSEGSPHLRANNSDFSLSPSCIHSTDTSECLHQTPGSQPVPRGVYRGSRTLCKLLHKPIMTVLFRDVEGKVRRDESIVGLRADPCCGSEKSSLRKLYSLPGVKTPCLHPLLGFLKLEVRLLRGGILSCYYRK